jgi:hypothetical protein
MEKASFLAGKLTFGHDVELPVCRSLQNITMTFISAIGMRQPNMDDVTFIIDGEVLLSTTASPSRAVN